MDQDSSSENAQAVSFINIASVWPCTVTLLHLEPRAEDMQYDASAANCGVHNKFCEQFFLVVILVSA